MDNSRLHHYIHLTRLHKPVGTILLLWPALWSLWFAAGGIPNLKVLLIFIAGGFVIRAAGCVINDFADRHFDAHVERTNYRPIATGKIQPWEAVVLFTLLSLIAFALVLLTNRLTVVFACIGIVIIAAYPFMKRYTHLPQLVLGLAWSWSIPMAFAAQTSTFPPFVWVPMAGVICWTIVFDTFYAMVDREDDLRIGIKSTAILFGDRDLLVIAVFQLMAVIAFAVTGWLFDRDLFYFIGIAIIAGMFAHQIHTARRRDKDGSFKAFMDNRFIGLTLFVAIVLDYALFG